jgi:hypothetical protein
MEGQAMAEYVVSMASQRRGALPELTWEQITEPGAYVEKGTGDLYRIPMEALPLSNTPMMRQEGAGAPRFVQLSKNPYITTLEARMLCAASNIQPNF